MLIEAAPGGRARGLILSARMGEGAVSEDRVLVAGPDRRIGSVTAGTGAAAQRAARRALRGQIGRLEAELGDAVLSSFQMRGRAEGAHPVADAGRATPRLLDLGELEIVRDELAHRLHAVRSANARRAEDQAERRAQLQQMLLAPGRHRFVRISCAELGDPGCGVWHVRPRLGLIGMLAGWWQVKLSSGCPLPGRSAAAAA
jgi:hypothetical protein